MGYGTERFPAPLPDEMICCVCLDVYRNPQQLKCQHTLCHDCAMQMLSDDGFHCPKCRSVCRNLKKPSLFFRETYYKLMLRCQWHRFGCPETIPIGEEQRHEEKCFHSGQIPKACPAGCPYYGPLLLPDGTDHHCIQFMMQVIRDMQSDNDLLKRRNQQQHKDMVQMQVDAKESRDQLIEHASRMISDARAQSRRAAGDA